MKVDVLVCGGGCAGMGAAIRAARAGASVLLVERAPFAGGILTTVGLPFLDGIACWRTGRIVVRGLALELLARMGQATPDVKRIEEIQSNIRFDRHGSVALPCIDRFKIVADEALIEAGVRVLFHAIVCGTETQDGRIARVLVASKDGLMRVEPGVVVDCTGDADVAHFSGCPMDARTELMPMTMHFRIGNVGPNGSSRNYFAPAAEALKRATADGKLPMYYGPGLSIAFAPDEVYVHAVRVPGNAADAFDLTRAEMQGRRDAWTMYEYWKKYVPGFEHSYFIGSGPFIGVRETRRISGRYVLNEHDLLESKSFDDAIATGCWYMDLHPNKSTPGGASDPEDKFVPTHTANWGGVGRENATPPSKKWTESPEPYDIPYRSLLPRTIDNLLVAGRCHSATRNAAGSTRVTVTAMAMGEAAGAAAAMAIKTRKNPAELNGVAVREHLSAGGAGPFTRA